MNKVFPLNYAQKKEQRMHLLILGLNSCNVASLYVYCDLILCFQSHERLSYCVLLVFKSNIFLARVIEKFEFNVL